MKTLALLFLVIFPVIYITSPSSVSIVKAEGTSDTKYWALLVCGSEDSFQANADYMYHVIRYHYAFDGIYYLHINASVLGVNATATKQNVSEAITNWLANKSGPDDVIFIYMNSHGGGYQVSPQGRMVGGRYDDSDEEGDEHYNSTTESWFGVDECIFLHQDQTYWDDELKEDLDTLTGNYSTLIFVRQGCYGGGLIDDLSAPNRIIMTATSETNVAYGDLDTPEMPPNPPYGEYPDGYSEWSEVFIDALHGEDTYRDQSQIPHVIHEEPPDIVCADLNSDGDVSMWEAWEYALDHDDAAHELPLDVYGVVETPWLDDDGNGYPTYINKTNELDEDDGSLANATCLPRRLTVQTYAIDGPMIENITVWIDDISYSSPVSVNVFGGPHNVTVQSTYYQDGYEYKFDHWEDNSTSNSRSITLDSNTIIRAYYNETYFGTVNLTVQTYVTDDTEIEGVMVWIDGEAYQAPLKPPVNVTVFAGPHTVLAHSIFNRDDYEYTFQYWLYWESNSTDNPITLTFLNNTIMRAYYSKEYAPPGGGGGGGGDPLFTPDDRSTAIYVKRVKRREGK